MGRPRLIILIRHGQSEGNKNRDIHQYVPDHRIKLTDQGWAQAHEAGRRLRSLLRPDDTLHFYTSPYRRTRETTEGIISTLTADDPEPSPFKRPNIKVYEEPRLREQDFGNFQPCSAEMERMWQERADYGHFFYRIPNGESAADAYDRVSGFNESLWRQFGEDDFSSVCVLVTHGLMSRVFLMKWYHFSVEYFEDLRNINHCEFLVMRRQDDNGKYILENKLRTWSELKRQRAALRTKEPNDKDGLDDNSKLDRRLVAPRRWGGCPNGCNHSKQFKVRRDLAELRQIDEAAAAKSSLISCDHICDHAIGIKRLESDDESDPRGKPDPDLPQIDLTKSQDDVNSLSDGTSSYVTVEHRSNGRLKESPSPISIHPSLHLGRDGGGTYSGHNSEAELSEDDAKQRLAATAARVKDPTKATSGVNGSGTGVAANGTSKIASTDGCRECEDEARYLQESGMGRGVCANRLGDSPASCSENGDGSFDGGDEMGDGDDLDKAEKEDRSIMGSVY